MVPAAQVPPITRLLGTVLLMPIASAIAVPLEAPDPFAVSTMSCTVVPTLPTSYATRPVVAFAEFDPAIVNVAVVTAVSLGQTYTPANCVVELVPLAIRVQVFSAESVTVPVQFAELKFPLNATTTSASPALTAWLNVRVVVLAVFVELKPRYVRVMRFAFVTPAALEVLSGVVSAGWSIGI